METIIVVIFVATLIVSSVSIFVGLDLKKKSSWLYGLFGFVCGFLAGFIIADLNTGLLSGALLAFVIMYGGAMTHWQRQRFK